MYIGYGVCHITDVREEMFGPMRQMYYVLQPIKDSRSTFYCPVKQEEKLRAVLTREDVDRLIGEMPQVETVWQEDETKRRQMFATMLKSGDRAEAIRLIKTLYRQRKIKAQEGKKLHLADGRVMQEAERLLYEEIAHVMAIQPDEVVTYIENTLHQ